MKASELKKGQVFKISQFVDSSYTYSVDKDMTIDSTCRWTFDGFIPNLNCDVFSCLGVCKKTKALLAISLNEEVELCAESCSSCKRDFGSYCLEANNSGQCGDCYGSK